jgi:hypothetical protein
VYVNGSRKVENDYFAFRGDDALWVKLDPLKELRVQLALARTKGDHLMDDFCLSDTWCAVKHIVEEYLDMLVLVLFAGSSSLA